MSPWKEYKREAELPALTIIVLFPTYNWSVFAAKQFTSIYYINLFLLPQNIDALISWYNNPVLCFLDLIRDIRVC